MPTTTNNNTFPGFDRAFRKLSAAEFQRLHGAELQRSKELKAQGVDTKALDAELARIAELQRRGKPIPKLDLDKFVTRTPTNGLPTTTTTTIASPAPTTSPISVRFPTTTTPTD